MCNRPIDIRNLDTPSGFLSYRAWSSWLRFIAENDLVCCAWRVKGKINNYVTRPASLGAGIRDDNKLLIIQNADSSPWRIALLELRPVRG